MAYFPANCDHNCKGCSQNKCGWCAFLDTFAEDYYNFENSTTAYYTDEDKYHTKEE